MKFCGLTRSQDVEIVNELKPDYIGFVFFPKSKRYVSPEQARQLKSRLCPEIKAVGVFVNEEPEIVADLLENGTIDMAQLHGKEDEAYIKRLRHLTNRPILQAFRVDTEADIQRAERSTADFILLDSGAGGTGTTFDWNLLKHVSRPYFVAGGLGVHNIINAVETLHPFGVDVISGIEENGVKDPIKMQKFADLVRDFDEISGCGFDK
ncbi:MAG: phosphoribosylanthranilate isomerase [Lachnospiraceae bacterium]|nr:phosphoribosylanthranilate isomerase [Lachnospiraceae bacterium]